MAAITTIGEFMAAAGTPNPSLVGEARNDDFVFGIDTSDNQNADVDDYLLAIGNITQFTSSVSSTSQDKTYLREGQSSITTGHQRSFSYSGDRKHGSPFQDYLFDVANLYAVGSKAVRKYVYFSALTGEGERGQVTILPASDAGGNAGEQAAWQVEFKQNGPTPEAYTYAAGE
jgi:hypothetical protein